MWGTAPPGLWARRPSVFRSGGVGDPLRTSLVLGAGLLTPTSAARVCWLADVGLESPTYPDLRRTRMLGAGLLTPPAGATEGLPRHKERIAGDQSVLGRTTRLPESVGAGTPLDGMPAPNLPVLAPDLHKCKVVRFKST